MNDRIAARFYGLVLTTELPQEDASMYAVATLDPSETGRLLVYAHFMPVNMHTESAAELSKADTSSDTQKERPSRAAAAAVEIPQSYLMTEAFDRLTKRWHHDDIAEQVIRYGAEYSRGPTRGPANVFGNKCDFHALEMYFGKGEHGGNSALCTKDSHVLIGGANRGQLAKPLLEMCPGVSLVGVEVQRPAWQRATETIMPFPNARMLHAGWSDRNGKSSVVGLADGMHETAFLNEGGSNVATWNPGDTSFSGCMVIDDEVDIWRLETFVTEQKISSALLVIIDAEGHEPTIIAGMNLDLVANRRRFPIFHYELGGTWAENDPRHRPGSLSQFGIAAYLEACGYKLYLIGCVGFMPVGSRFFHPVAHHGKGQPLDEGYGPFVQGNALAIHPEFANPKMLAKINSHLIVP